MQNSTKQKAEDRNIRIGLWLINEMERVADLHKATEKKYASNSRHCEICCKNLTPRAVKPAGTQVNHAIFGSEPRS